MKKTISLILIAAMTALTGLSAATNNKSKGKEKQKEVANFNGKIKYIGKVTRIPDRSKTAVKLNDFEGEFYEYYNDEYVKREENINNQLKVSNVTGIKSDIFFQTIESIVDKTMIYITATPDEQRQFQLTPRMMRANSKKITFSSGKLVVLKRKCKKVVCNMVTEDNIHLQLVAWYDPNLKINGFCVPYFGKIDFVPLKYDFYNGEYVVTYTATEIKEMPVFSGTFDRPDATPITMTEYVMSQQQ
jgi:hypothetical protein